MKFAGAIAFALTALPTVFGAAVAEPARDLTFEARDSGTVIVNAINAINVSVTNVDNEVLKVNSADVNQLLAVNTAAQSLNSLISSETTSIQGQANVTDLIEALQIQVATSTLISTVQKLSTDLINIKSYVAQAGVTSVVLQVLQSSKTNSDALADAIGSKIPSEFSFIADYDKSQIDDALTKAINAYSS